MSSRIVLDTDEELEAAVENARKHIQSMLRGVHVSKASVLRTALFEYVERHVTK